LGDSEEGRKAKDGLKPRMEWAPQEEKANWIGLEKCNM
jgi:hypothetical protein